MADPVIIWTLAKCWQTSPNSKSEDCLVSSISNQGWLRGFLVCIRQYFALVSIPNLFRFATVKHRQLGSDKSPGQQPLGGGQPERAGADPGLQLVLNITWLQRRPPAELQACGRRRKWAAGRRPGAGSRRYFKHANGGLQNAREFGKLTFLVGIRSGINNINTMCWNSYWKRMILRLCIIIANFGVSKEKPC